MFLGKKLLKQCSYIVVSLLLLQFFLYYTSKFRAKNIVRLTTDNKDDSESEKINWELKAFIDYEATRTGPGEQGEPFQLVDPEEITHNTKLSIREGFYVLVSDKISVDRALPDMRPKASV
jgi:hypothetical protein